MANLFDGYGQLFVLGRSGWVRKNSKVVGIIYNNNIIFLKTNPKPTQTPTLQKV